SCFQRSVFSRCKVTTYLTVLSMYSTAAFRVASSAVVAPRGGMAPLPLMATSIMASMPRAISGSQAFLSPSLGALATPVVWQATQADLYSFSPLGWPAALAVAFASSLAAALAGVAAAPFLAGAAAVLAGATRCLVLAALSAASFALSGETGPAALICFIKSSFHLPSTTKWPAAP